MFSEFVDPLYSAILVFPLVALIFTLPYLLYQYRKYGSVVIFKAIVVYSFILYLLCMYFLVILPLPSFEEAATGTGPLWQLRPLSLLDDIRAIEGFSFREIGTYGLLLHSVSFLHGLLNVVMFVPFGIYLRYYFKKGFFLTIFLAIVLSVFFELTQLSGLYGIYPRPYRLCDIDDVILNTLGAFIGFLLAPLVTWLFPKKEKLDKISYSRGKSISPIRRFLAALIDWLPPVALTWFLGNFWPGFGLIGFSWGNILIYIIWVVLYFMVISYLMDGATLGKKLLRLGVVAKDYGSASFIQYVIRYSLLYYVFLPSLYVAVKLNELSYEVEMSWAVTIIVGVFALIFLIFLSQAIAVFFKDDKRMLHETLSNTRTKNYIPK